MFTFELKRKSEITDLEEHWVLVNGKKVGYVQEFTTLHDRQFHRLAYLHRPRDWVVREREGNNNTPARDFASREEAAAGILAFANFCLTNSLTE